MLFNSYYEMVGPYFPRTQRGTLSRPAVDEVPAYREQIDRILLEWIATVPSREWTAVVPLIGWGLQHEQQHQELRMMDILAKLAANPIAPAYLSPSLQEASPLAPLEWLEIPEGATHLGYDGPGFFYDNESPRHTTWLETVRIANRTVTQGEFAEFVKDGGLQIAMCWPASTAKARRTLRWTSFIMKGSTKARQGGWQCFWAVAAVKWSPLPVRQFHLARGERLLTKYSYKYTVAEFHALAQSAGWNPVKVWTDPENIFSLHYLRPMPARREGN